MGGNTVCGIVFLCKKTGNLIKLFAQIGLALEKLRLQSVDDADSRT